MSYAAVLGDVGDEIVLIPKDICRSYDVAAAQAKHLSRESGQAYRVVKIDEVSVHRSPRR